MLSGGMHVYSMPLRMHPNNTVAPPASLQPEPTHNSNSRSLCLPVQCLPQFWVLQGSPKGAPSHQLHHHQQQLALQGNVVPDSRHVTAWVAGYWGCAPSAAACKMAPMPGFAVTSTAGELHTPKPLHTWRSTPCSCTMWSWLHCRSSEISRQAAPVFIPGSNSSA